jgi:hypothetical protein
MNRPAPSDWQRRYNESVEAERARNREPNPDEEGAKAIDIAGYLPGWMGLVVLVVATSVLVIRRSIRRH